MAVTLVTLTADPATLVGADPDKDVKFVVRTNAGGAIIDAAGNKIFLGTYSAKVLGATTFSATLPPTNAATNPTNFQYQVDIEYVDAATSKRVQWHSGWFSLTTSKDLAVVAAEQYVPPTFMTTATATLQGYVDEGQALRDDQAAIAGLTGEDTAVEYLVRNPSATKTALSDSYAGLKLLDIKNYGAACDGTTNDVLAWRAAIADVATKRAAGKQIDGITWSGTTRIEVNGTGSEAGTDTSSSGTKFAVVIPSNFVVAGDGPNSIIKMTGVPATANGNPNQNSALGVEDGTKRVVFRDFQVVGENGADDGTGFTYLLNNQSAAIDILLTNSRDILVERVLFRNLYGFSVHDRGENKRVHVKNCTTRYCANGINVNSNYSELIGNAIANSEGLECGGQAITITGNTIENAYQVGISAGGNFGTNAERPGSIVGFNTIDGVIGGNGISVADAFVGGLIVGNTVRRTDKHGISITASTGSHVNYGNIVANNNVVSCGLSTALASDRIGINVAGTGATLLVGNRVVDNAIAGYSQYYGIRVLTAGTRLLSNIVNGTNWDIELASTATGVYLDDNNGYSTLSLVSGASLASKTIATDQLHKGVETFNHHIVAQHPASGVSNFTVAVGAAATAASRNKGTDAAGQVNYTTAGGTTGALFTVTFARAYAVAPVVVPVCTDARMAAAQLHVNATTTGFTVSCAAAHAAGTSGFQWIAIGT